MAKVQVFIATYNRESLILKAVDSVLKQSFKSIEIVVSDNSTNEETKKLLSNIKDERLKYIKRETSLPAIDHLNTILSEITADAFMIFHDDDMMEMEMVERLFDNLNSENGIVAVGANAFVIKHGKRQSQLFMNSSKNSIVNSFEGMAEFYLSSKKTVPLPSYMYRKIVAEKLQFNLSFGGKYCDASFIMNLTKYGAVKLVNEPLMKYFFHETNDSATNSFFSRNRLVVYICENTELNGGSRLIRRYRSYNNYVELISLYRRGLRVNYKAIICHLYFLMKNSPLNYFPKALLYLTIK